MAINRKLRMGMVGGGRDAFIGSVHRMAASLDGQIELVCGAFSSNAQKSKLSGKDLFLPANRVYSSYEEMFRSEAKLPDGERMDLVSIVTPNNVHYPVAKMALEAGFHVVCDKPMTISLAEAKKLQQLVKKTGLLFGLTHNYTGYPMVKEARSLVASGKLGRIRKVVVEYPQAWLADRIEKAGQKQAAWRTDPKQTGAACCMGDIGTHAENLMEYITGHKITELCADLTTFVKGRPLEDDGNVLIRLNGGARGILHASQISIGEENGLRIAVYGEKAGLKWVQLEPNTLMLCHPNRPTESLRAGANYANLSPAAQSACRLPCGHPEGFIEAFANVYHNFALALRCRLEGKKIKPQYLDFPNVADGVRGMAFIETVVASSKSSRKWTKMKT